MRLYILFLLLATVITVAAVLLRRLSRGGPPVKVPAARPPAGRPVPYQPRLVEPGYETIVPPPVRGRQHLCIEAGTEDTVCTLSSYGDRMALGRADPYLVVRIPASARADLYDLRAGTYDILIETGYDWDREARAFRVPRTRRRSMQPLRLFGPHTLVITAYPVANGDFQLTDL
ncbi:hypothetical protein [Streptomyces phytophilus]|uniref:hypothetical protein n=1 Tax=Streptomyces phytophilus TaxID=722715 RepID=UPI0015F123BC|nr:hypothetical protein [Streptomyces phytophilus]